MSRLSVKSDIKVMQVHSLLGLFSRLQSFDFERLEDGGASYIKAFQIHILAYPLALTSSHNPEKRAQWAATVVSFPLTYSNLLHA
jgi:hypothetical protein